MEPANYKGRFNLRVDLVTAEKLFTDRLECKPNGGLRHRTFAAFRGGQ